MEAISIARNEAIDLANRLDILVSIVPEVSQFEEDPIGYYLYGHWGENAEDTRQILYAGSIDYLIEWLRNANEVVIALRL